VVEDPRYANHTGIYFPLRSQTRTASRRRRARWLGRHAILISLLSISHIQQCSTKTISQTRAHPMHTQSRTRANDTLLEIAHATIIDFRRIKSEHRNRPYNRGKLLFHREQRASSLTHYRPAMPFGNRNIYFKGSFKFSIVKIKIYHPHRNRKLDN